MSEDEDDTPIPWYVSLMDLPTELYVKIFLTLFNQQSVVALRLTCRKLEDVYQRIAETVRVDQREHIVVPVRNFLELNFLEFLDRFKLPNDRVRHPPPGGWPHIQPGPGNGLESKTPLALDILRHLSYIYDLEPQFDYYDGCITHRSTMVDYSETDSYQGGQEDMWLDESGFVGDDHPPPSEGRHILTLAKGWEGPGHSIYIDTWTGLVYEDEAECGPSAPIILAQDFFSDRIKSLKRFDEVFVPGEHTIYRRQAHYEREQPWQNGHYWDREERYVEYDPDDDPYDAEAMERQGEHDGTNQEFGCMEDADWIRHLYFKHGWPGEDWDKEACLKAIRDFVHRRHQRSGRW
ncbi:hypothetical protein VDGD_02804 [Verticillium dahliae]|nr:hypothetical protein VDGD_02804 [Verticillium dahliae]